LATTTAAASFNLAVFAFAVMEAMSDCHYLLSAGFVSDIGNAGQTSPMNPKMSTVLLPEEQPRPHQHYKRDLLDRIRTLAPKSLLDVGCGDGELLRAATLAGCAQCTGLEVHENFVSEHREHGMDVRLGRAEALPFPDQSFDVVTFDYVAHHLEHLERALLEAARVARRAVLVLEPWYDVTIASQQVALDFDNWSKVIDRRQGLVHNPCVSVTQLTAPLLMLGGFRIDYGHRLILQAMPLSRMEALAREQLAAIGDVPDLKADLLRLLDRARLHGITDDGALCFCATRA
jgi:SAM-dependent methyltransferase